MTLPEDLHEGDTQLTQLELKADELINEWRSSLPDEPWNVIKSLMLTVLQQYPDVILLTNDRATQIMVDHQILLPPGKSIGDIAGRANPGLARLRNIPRN